MYKKNDPNSITKFFELKSGGVKVGQLIVDFHVVDYDNVQVQDFSSINKPNNRKFLLHCTQRIIISTNNNPLLTAPTDDIDSYENYLAFIDNSLTVKDSNNNNEIDIQLLDYSPKTINTQIQRSDTSDTSSGTSSSNSRSTTSGSSMSDTNSFGTSVSLSSHASLMDAGISSNTTVNQEHSSTVTNEHSITSGSEVSNNKNQSLSESASMSIKDWGAFAYLEQNSDAKIGWIFAQQYPWDAIRCRKTVQDSQSNGKVQLIIPNEMLANLYDGESLLPPSELSLFGVNFVSKSLYLISFDNDSESININHSVLLYTASHQLITNKQVAVYIAPQCVDTFTDDPTSINLPIMSLDVLGLPDKQAIVGFSPNKFIKAPSPMNSGKVSVFKISSASNTLYIKDTTDYKSITDNGAGFTASQTRLTASFSELGTNLSFTLYFKVVDTGNYYNLYLKHWITQGSKGIKLTLTINEDSENAIVKYVDAEEAVGAEKNLLTIALRDLDYASIDYHDYLQLGLNSIKVTIEPIDGQYSVNCGYEIRAISIEKA